MMVFLNPFADEMTETGPQLQHKQDTVSTDTSNEFPNVKILFNPSGDGNCQFESMSHQMMHVLGRDVPAAAVRTSVVSYLRRNPLSGDNKTPLSEFIPGKNWTKYLETMENSGVWGDTITLQAFADNYKVNVLVLSSLGVDAATIVSPGGKFDDNKPYLILGHIAESHYFSANFTDICFFQDIIQGFKSKTLDNYESQSHKSEFSPSDSKTDVLAEISQSCFCDSNTHDYDKLSENIEESKIDGMQEKTFIPIYTCNQPKERADYGPNFSKIIGGRERRFQFSWYDRFQWLHWVPQLGGVLCLYCSNVYGMGMLTMTKNEQTSFLTYGYKDWKEATRAFPRHEVSSCHRESILKWNLYINAKPIDAHLNVVKNKEQENARVCLLKQMRSLKYLLRQGLAIRGKEETEGNYNQLLIHRAEDDELLSAWLKSKHSKWTSHEIQDEQMEMMANDVLRRILKLVREREFYAVIVDETTDVSTHEQVSISLRTVSDDFEIHEEFVGFYETSSTTAETLVTIIKDVLLRFQLPISKCRGQSYDGAAAMSGKHTGVAARILKEESRALNTHCLAHSLNLAVQDTTRQIPQIDDLLATVQELSVIIRGSAKRLSLFGVVQQEFQSDGESPTLKPLCPTRWTVRHSALTAVHKNIRSILETLRLLAEDKAADMTIKAKARGLINTISTFGFVFSLKLSILIFEKTDDLSRTLQTQKLNIGSALKSAEVIKIGLNRAREDTSFEQMWTACLSETEIHEFGKPKLPRYCRRPSRFDDGAAPHKFEDAKEYFKHVYISAVDAVNGEIARRFDQPVLKIYVHIEECIKKSMKGENCEEHLLSILSHFHDDLNETSLRRQLLALQDLWRMHVLSLNSIPKSFGIDDVIKLIQGGSHLYVMFDQVVRMIKLFLVLPVTSATAERSFSALRRLKTYLRSVMDQDRLNNVAILHVHKPLTDSIDFVQLASEFVIRKTNRAQKFGCFTNA